MPIGQDEDIRIYELPEAQELTAGMKVAVDSETDGTKSFDITTAMSEKVEEFVAEYNVTSYEDIDAAYKAGKSVICKYQPSPQGNPEQVYYLRSMQYIPFAGYMFGTITSILGFEFIVCRKNNDTTVWSVSHDNALKTPDSGEANGKILSTNGTNTLWIDPPEGIPSSTAQDEGKVLTVDSNGAAAWAASGGGTEKFIIRGLVYPSSASYIDNDKAVVDKTTTEIMAAYESGQELELQFYVINDTTITAADIDSKFAEKKDSLAPCKANLSFAYIPDTSGNIRFGFTFRSSEMYSFESYYYQGMPSAYEYTRTCSQIRIEISRYSSDDSDWISASSYANDLGKWQIQVDYWSDNTTETYGNNWDYFYNTVKYYMKNHNSIDLRLAISGVNTPSYVAHLSDYLLSNNSSYPPLLLFTHLYVPACLQGQAYRTEVRWYKFYPLEEVDPDTGETVKACKLSYGIIETQPMLPNLSVNNSTGFTISSSPWILPENNTYITPTIDSSLTELVILVSDNNTIGFNAGSNPQFTMKFSLSGGRTLRVRVGHQFDNGVIYYFNYDADKGRDLVSPSGVYSTNFVIKVVGTSWTFEKLAEDTNS